ncbi:uncharacterized protein LOC144114310 [Amblyomma americanum]
MDMGCFAEGHLSSLLQCLEFKILCRNARVLLPWWNAERTSISWRIPDMTPEPESAAQAGLLVGRHRVGDVMKLWVMRTETRLFSGRERNATTFRYPVEHCPFDKHLCLGDAFLAANIFSWPITSDCDLPAMITLPTYGMFGFTLSLLCLDGGPSPTCYVAATGA